MIQPLRARASARRRTISSRTAGRSPDTRISSGVPEVGAPEDVQVGVGQVGEGRAAVEHHDHVVDVAGHALVGEPAAGGDQHGRADPVEDQPVRGGQCGDAADARDRHDPQLVVGALGDPLEQGQGAVVQRRVAPDEEGAGLPGRSASAIIAS